MNPFENLEILNHMTTPQISNKTMKAMNNVNMKNTNRQIHKTKVTDSIWIPATKAIQRWTPKTDLTASVIQETSKHHGQRD